MARKIFAGTFGLLAWFMTQFLAMGMAGGGHGWNGSFFLTFPLLVLYPLTAIRALASTDKTTRFDAGIMAAAIGLDLLLLLSLAAEQDHVRQVISLGRGFVGCWFLLWLGWQVLGFSTLCRKWYAQRKERDA